jgi:hypothetical protein
MIVGKISEKRVFPTIENLEREGIGRQEEKGRQELRENSRKTAVTKLNKNRNLML